MTICEVYRFFSACKCFDWGASRSGQCCNRRRTHAGYVYALIAAMSGSVPMIFMTRVRL